MRPVADLLARLDLPAPDGRPLHAYDIAEEEQDRLGHLLAMRIAAQSVSPVTAQGFVLWAAEHLRTRFAGGQLTWEFVFAGLGQEYDRAIAVRLTETGLNAWGRSVRRRDSGDRAFLFSLLAEGGLPDLALADASRYCTALLALVAEIEAEGELGVARAPDAARRAVRLLPQVLQTDELQDLLAELGTALAGLRRSLPEGLAADAAVGWLDAHRPGWRHGLPLRLSPQALTTLVQPALVAARLRPSRDQAPVLRQLRRGLQG